MKIFRLSTPAERATSAAFVAAVLVAFGLLLYALRNSIGLLIVCGLAIVLISVMLVICYLLWEKKKERNFFLLFLCVAAANCGYFLQSVSDTLAGALAELVPTLLK